MTLRFKSFFKLDQAPNPWSNFSRHLLAEGDSWFSVGALNIAANSCLVNELILPGVDALVVNCAAPGHLIQHMADRRGQDQFFTETLQGTPQFGRFWEGILLSGGGNDLIAALRVEPTEIPDLRILLRPEETAAGTAIERYVSEAGWARLSDFLFASVRTIAGYRDASLNPAAPIIQHTYATPTARYAGTLSNDKGWLKTRLDAYGIPEADQQALTVHLFQRLRELIKSFAVGTQTQPSIAGLHVFDTAGVPGLVPAAVGSTGNSGDWINEIHLNRDGYRKLGKPLGVFVDQVLKQAGF